MTEPVARLVLTVATIGLSQLLAVCALLLPKLWHERPDTFRIDGPLHLSFEVSPVIFSGDDVLASSLGTESGCTGVF